MDKREAIRSDDCSIPAGMPDLGLLPIRPVPCEPGDRFQQDTHFPPSAVRPPRDALQPSAPFRVFNYEQSASCTAPASGSPVIVPEDAVGVSIPLETLPRIRPEAVIASAQILASSPAVVLALRTALASEVILLLPLLLFQADAFVELRDAAQVEVDATALTLAQSGLECLWPSAEVTVTCTPDVDENAALLTGDSPEALNPVTVVAGSFNSPNGQAAADQLAEAHALLQLRCVWGSEEVVADCPAGTVTDPAASAIAGRVASVTLPALHSISSDSVADANTRALAEATAGLNCVFFNPAAGEVSCDNGAPDSVPEGNLATSTPGNPVNYPAYGRGSYVSEADALALIEAEASTLLVCEWVNEEITRDCPAQVYPLGSEDPADEQTADPLRSIPLDLVNPGRVVIAAGTVRSQISEEDLNNQIEALISSLQTCIYCNKGVAARCTMGGSISETAGVPASSFCGPDYSAVQAQATIEAALPTSALVVNSDACQFSSSPILAYCSTSMPEDYDPETDDPDWTPEAVVVYQRAAGDLAFHPTSISRVFLPAGSVVAAGSQEAVDATAEAIALLQLDCFFLNVPQEVDECTPPLINLQIGTVAGGEIRSALSQTDANERAHAQATMLAVCLSPDTFGSVNIRIFTAGISGTLTCASTQTQARDALLAAIAATIDDELSSGDVFQIRMLGQSSLQRVSYLVTAAGETTTPDDGVYAFDFTAYSEEWWATATIMPCPDSRPFQARTQLDGADLVMAEVYSGLILTSRSFASALTVTGASAGSGATHCWCHIEWNTSYVLTSAALVFGTGWPASYDNAASRFTNVPVAFVNGAGDLVQLVHAHIMLHRSLTADGFVWLPASI